MYDSLAPDVVAYWAVNLTGVYWIVIRRSTLTMIEKEPALQAKLAFTHSSIITKPAEKNIIYILLLSFLRVIILIKTW